MTEDLELEGPKGRPWMLAVGMGLAVVAGALWLYSRRSCDCEEGAEKPSPFASVKWLYSDAANASTSINGHTEPEVDPLAWDTHAEMAWGATPAGPRKLDAWAAASHSVEEQNDHDEDE